MLEPVDVLLALLESMGVGVYAITNQGIKLKAVRRYIIEHFGYAPQSVVQEGILKRLFSRRKREIPALSDELNSMLATASQEAASLRCNYVGTEHVLLAIMKDGGPASEFLDKHGIHYHETRQTVQQLLGIAPSP
jgi:ATP-dependent Clp protease ATP-binding subunit ClpA